MMRERTNIPSLPVGCVDPNPSAQQALHNDTTPADRGLDRGDLNSVRRRRSNPAAEQIAASADRLEQQAAEVRPSDKRLALYLVKEATRLRNCARALEIQHKRAVRAVMARLNDTGLNNSQARLMMDQ
jgi:hypothetical protein